MIERVRALRAQKRNSAGAITPAVAEVERRRPLRRKPGETSPHGGKLRRKSAGAITAPRLRRILRIRGFAELLETNAKGDAGRTWRMNFVAPASVWRFFHQAVAMLNWVFDARAALKPLHVGQRHWILPAPTSITLKGRRNPPPLPGRGSVVCRCQGVTPRRILRAFGATTCRPARTNE